MHSREQSKARDGHSVTNVSAVTDKLIDVKLGMSLVVKAGNV